MTRSTLLNHGPLPANADLPALQRKVMGWFAAGHEILWIPIIEVAPGGEADARAMADRLGEPRLLRTPDDLFTLPLFVKGWLFPAHLEDTDALCLRETERRVSFGHLAHPRTGERISYRTPTEAGLFA
jgi:hypothetical protein